MNLATQLRTGFFAIATLILPAQAQTDTHLEKFARSRTASASDTHTDTSPKSPVTSPIDPPDAVPSATIRIPIEFTSPGATPGPNAARKPAPSSEVVVWLSARPGASDPQFVAPSPGHFRIEQKDKSFHPHLLVIPLGSIVEFPNRDPFFHNVFSQFNGKRFDLGLYEAGTNKSVHFDHEGVSYIFCNIHSQMAAVIIAVDTRFSTVLKGPGLAEFRNVPPGDYVIHVWREGVEPAQLNDLAQPIHVTATTVDASPIRIPESAPPAPHKNKFSEDYPLDPSLPYPH